VDYAEREGIAAAILRDAGQGDDEPVRLARLVIAHLGSRATEYLLGLRHDAELTHIHDEWRIRVRHCLPLERRIFAIAHELAEWWLRVRECYAADDVEDVANYIAAAIVAPARAFQRAVVALGHDLPALSDAFRVTETCAALRLGEVLHVPLAVITPRCVRVRGPEAWVWPDEETLRQWAQGRWVPRLRRTKLTDSQGRIVLNAQDVN